MPVVSIGEWNPADVTDLDNVRVVEIYKEKFGGNPEWVIRCPGRVNLIGEHVDHNGYGVFPMAIKVSTFIAVGIASNGSLNFENANPGKYRSVSCDVRESVTMTKLGGHPEWFHYFIAGWRGAIESTFSITNGPFPAELINQISGLNVAVAGSIPPSAGLSSSSALVCAATLATLAIQTNRTSLATIERKDLAEIATKAERFVGTEGGGMDQACECLADADYALRIDFNPLSCSQVRLPKRALFAVMHSGTEMNKAASDYYNRRVVECRLAAQIICKRAGKFNGNSVEIMKHVRTLRHAAAAFELDGADPALMLPNVEKYLSNENGGCYTRRKVCEILEITDEQLMDLSLSANTMGVQEFWLTKRARHVYSEAARVLAFERVCLWNTEAESSADESGDKEVLAELARLMNESHASCRDDFECSCSELDALVAKCLASGCLGARLTGAGWGGCAVALIDTADQPKINSMAKELNILFWSEPSEGIKALKVGDE